LCNGSYLILLPISMSTVQTALHRLHNTCTLRMQLPSEGSTAPLWMPFTGCNIQPTSCSYFTDPPGFHSSVYLPNPSNVLPPKAVYAFQKFLHFLSPLLSHMCSPPQPKFHYPYKVKLCVLFIMYYHNLSLTLHSWAKLAFTGSMFFSQGKRSHLQH